MDYFFARKGKICRADSVHLLADRHQRQYAELGLRAPGEDDVAAGRQSVQPSFDYLRQFGLRFVQKVEVVEDECQRRTRLHG